MSENNNTSINISIQEMLEFGVHFGHQTKYWNPKMKPFIFGSRNKIHIINLDKTVVLFKDALNFLQNIAKNRGEILLVCTRSQANGVIAEEAARAGIPYVDKRWLGGMLTNFETVKKSIKKLETKTQLLEKANESGLSKKEILDLTREVAKLQASIGGIKDMKDLPAALFVIDTGCHDIAIKEAKRLGIPVVGVVDTNNDPTVVDYVIPGNDDSSKAIHYYASKVADAIIEAKEKAITELVSDNAKLELVEESDQKAKKKTVHRMKKSSEKAETNEEIATPPETPEIVEEATAKTQE